eukprot:1758492-Amphidinium_carterae.1
MARRLLHFKAVNRFHYTGSLSRDKSGCAAPTLVTRSESSLTDVRVYRKSQRSQSRWMWAKSKRVPAWHLVNLHPALLSAATATSVGCFSYRVG